jgi:ribonucleoside-diphosphate reductase alpha chain
MKKFSEVAKQLYGNENPETGDKAPLLADDVFEFIQANAEALDSAIVYDRDNDLDVFGFKTLKKTYLWRVNGQVVERPQHAMMRIAVGIFQPDLPMVLQAYEIYSKRLATHGSPTWFGAGTPNPTLSSCFLGDVPDDLDGIYENIKQCAMISKGAGGIGLAFHKVRAKNSYIASTGGSSNGLLPLLKVYNTTAEYVDQGGGKRRGAFAAYLAPWHADIIPFIESRAPGGLEELHARELFYGMWIPDLFMERVDKDEDWSLFCPKEAPGLSDCHGEAFRALYLKYEKTPGKTRPTLAREVIKARTVWSAILKSQQLTGMPYMCYSDSVNSKNAQMNVGDITHSNLCVRNPMHTRGICLFE